MAELDPRMERQLQLIQEMMRRNPEDQELRKLIQQDPDAPHLNQMIQEWWGTHGQADHIHEDYYKKAIEKESKEQAKKKIRQDQRKIIDAGIINPNKFLIIHLLGNIGFFVNIILLGTILILLLPQIKLTKKTLRNLSIITGTFGIITLGLDILSLWFSFELIIPDEKTWERPILWILIPRFILSIMMIVIGIYSQQIKHYFSSS